MGPAIQMTQNLHARIYVLDPLNTVFEDVAAGNYGLGATVLRIHLSDDVGWIEQMAAATACCLVLALPCPLQGGEEEELDDDEAFAPLRRLSSQFPTVAVGERGDAAFVEQALRLSVTDTVFLPARPGQIVQAVDTALQLDRQFLPARIRHAAVARQMQLLSARESEVMNLLVRGRSSKEIGAELEIGVQTVLKHRAHLLKKMGLRNDVELALTVQEFRTWPVHQRPGAGLMSLIRPEFAPVAWGNRTGSGFRPAAPSEGQSDGPSDRANASAQSFGKPGPEAAPAPAPTFRLNFRTSGG